MEKFKKHLKQVVLILFIILAATGAGFFGAPPLSKRQYQHETRPKTEMVYKKDEEQESEEDEEKS